MQKLSGTTMIPIPEDILIDELLENLGVGHGYRWTKLVTSPKLWVHGDPPPGDLPEILIIGKMIVIDGGEEYTMRFHRMLQALAQRSNLVGV
ncbi:MAG: hypothetical protein P1Q69_19200 [Candidatus Thorarchaeota archaeon]|nr:hypothetical protein [Candidatus Thorarchaeota archaeon]